MSIDSGISQLGRVPRKSGRLEDPDASLLERRLPAEEVYRQLRTTGTRAALLAELDALDPVTPTPRQDDMRALRCAARDVIDAARSTLVLRAPDHQQLIAALDQLERLARS